MASEELSRRERRVLEAVIRSYVETAEPAGSRTLSRRFGLGVSPATIRNTMSDLEEKGFLFHPHTSAGRVPTNKAYRALRRLAARVSPPFAPTETERLAEEITAGGGSSPIETILRRAAQTLGVLTQELGVALGPRLDHSVLAPLELVRVSSERLLMVLTLEAGVVRTVFVEVPGEIADGALDEVTAVLNERLAGLTLARFARRCRRACATRAPHRARPSCSTSSFRKASSCSTPPPDGRRTARGARRGVGARRAAGVLGRRPHAAACSRSPRRRTRWATRFAAALTAPGISITIGAEHDDPRFEDFTVVTAEYHVGSLAGVIGVIGPTRMPYDKVISLVSHTSRLVSDLLD